VSASTPWTELLSKDYTDEVVYMEEIYMYLLSEESQDRKNHCFRMHLFIH
jgi:hypothetical protein